MGQGIPTRLRQAPALVCLGRRVVVCRDAPGELELLSARFAQYRSCARRRVDACRYILRHARTLGVGAVSRVDTLVFYLGAQIQRQRSLDQHLAMDDIFFSQVHGDAPSSIQRLHRTPGRLGFAHHYSLILFGTLFMVALLRPDRRQYFTSGAPYTTIAVGILVLEPHIWWTVASDFPSIDYAISKTHYALAEARASAIRSVAGGLASLGIAAGAYGIAFGAQTWALLRRAVAGTFEGRNAWLIWLSHGPLLLTVAAYLFVNARITGSFLIPAFFATPIVFLVVAQADVTVVVLRRLVFCVAAIWLPMLVASPFLGYYTFTRADGAIDPSREIAIEATSLWRSTFGRPLRYVAGEEPLATAVTFYSPDAPSYMILDHPDYSPWVTVEQAKKQGLMIICPASAEACIEGGTTFAGIEGIRHERELAIHFLGLTSKPKQFVFIMRPPEH